MSIMAAYAQTDARGAAWLLAAAAKKCISDAASAAGMEYSLNNTFRLLESYRSKAFFGSSEPARQYAAGSAELLALVPSSEVHIAEVRFALGDALRAVSGDQSESSAIDRIEGVLRSVAYPTKFGESAAEDKELAVNFFDVLIQRLKIQ